jgi:hypothetical protein
MIDEVIETSYSNLCLYIYIYIYIYIYHLIIFKSLGSKNRFKRIKKICELSYLVFLIIQIA